MAPTSVDSLIINKTGGSSTPGNEITPNIPVVMPKHSISSTADKSQPKFIQYIKCHDKNLQPTIFNGYKSRGGNPPHLMANTLFCFVLFGFSPLSTRKTLARTHIQFTHI